MRRIARATIVAIVLGALTVGLAPAAVAQDAPAVPTAVDDHFARPLGISYEVYEPGVLANDVGVPGGGPLAAELVSFPDIGLIERFTPGGALVIIFIEPPALGDYELTYVVHQLVDGERRTSAPATVTLSITPPFPTVTTVEPVVLETTTGPLLGLGVTAGTATARVSVPDAGSQDFPLNMAVPLAPVTFRAGARVLCIAETDIFGVATCRIGLPGLLTAVLAGGVSASYDGNPFFGPSNGSAGLIGPGAPSGPPFGQVARR